MSQQIALCNNSDILWECFLQPLTNSLSSEQDVDGKIQMRRIREIIT
jgi:hypothetical protein